MPTSASRRLRTMPTEAEYAKEYDIVETGAVLFLCMAASCAMYYCFLVAVAITLDVFI